ncbi:MAG: DUF554 domain-containing protein [Clostridia bacterium]|nr:DUF554 domain-containing protein [Clostridia bacterium]
MIGLGTLINAAGILAGGVLGLLAGKGLKPRFRDILMTINGLSVIFIGASGALAEILTTDGDGFGTQGSMMMLFSLVLGGLLGELINIEKQTERFGEWLKKRTGSGDSHFVDGFVAASLTVCVGAMAVIGSINDGLSGDISILTTKAILDLIIVMVMTASMGAGCIFSAIPVLFFQGTITLLAGFIQPLMTETAVSNLSLVGSVLIFCVGVNLMFDKHIKVGNLLPSIVFAVAFAFVPIL